MIMPNQFIAPAQAAAQPQTTGTASSSSSASSSSNAATITSNDFLQLLVTEMQNQDPTADTDPNEYINQLVQVNSLEQLVQINQDLGGSASSGSSSGASGSDSGTTAASLPVAGTNTPSVAAHVTAGNLSAASSSAATRVANSLAQGAPVSGSNSSTGPTDSILSALRARLQQTQSATTNPAH